MAKEQLKKVITLDDVLGRNIDELKKLKEGSFYVEKLGGEIQFAEITSPEYSRIKKQCIKYDAKAFEMDDEKMKVLLIVAAVGKDTRSTFRFDDKRLLEKLDVTTAQEAVTSLLSLGEIHHMAIEIQTLSGLGDNDEADTSAAVKN